MICEEVVPVGDLDCLNTSSRVIRIVHISDTHHRFNVLTPPRPLSGNMAIRQSPCKESPNEIIDESGINAFDRQLSARSMNDESEETFFHRGGTFLSGSQRKSKKQKKSNEIPPGDVLVHSGDFAWNSRSKTFYRSENFEEIVQALNDFFDRFPHKVKLFVAGNHEGSLEGKKLQTVQERLHSAVYLYNSSYIYEGIHFYGAPYTKYRFHTSATGFQRHSNRIAAHWRNIPSKTDVLITHSPPEGILDLSKDFVARKFPRLSSAFHRVTPDSSCSICGIIHNGRSHWGCPHLREEVLIRIKPKLHLFGHVHEGNGVLRKNGIIFSNASFYHAKQLHVFDYYTTG